MSDKKPALYSSLSVGMETNKMFIPLIITRVVLCQYHVNKCVTMVTGIGFYCIMLTVIVIVFFFFLSSFCLKQDQT